jgi:hypothetical protein
MTGPESGPGELSLASVRAGAGTFDVARSSATLPSGGPRPRLPSCNPSWRKSCRSRPTCDELAGDVFKVVPPTRSAKKKPRKKGKA